MESRIWQNAVTIIDPLNELGNKFATSAGDLGSGLSRSASALHMAGSDIYETLAMLTGGAEITHRYAISVQSRKEKDKEMRD